MITLTIAAPTVAEARAHFERMEPALAAAGYGASDYRTKRDPDRAGSLLTVNLEEVAQ